MKKRSNGHIAKLRHDRMVIGVLLFAWMLLGMSPVFAAQNPNQLRLPQRESGVKTDGGQSSVIPNEKPSLLEYRSIDGSNNNLNQPQCGRADIPFKRLAEADYQDGTSALAGVDRPSPRLISNRVHHAAAVPPRGAAVSDMFWQWGQFLDHDLTLTPEIEPAQHADISIPTGDAWFDPSVDGDKVIPFARSSFSEDQSGVRQQHNFITAYIDASHIYGSDTVRAEALRINDGTGRLAVSAGNLLPFNRAGLPNAPDSSSRFFLAGDFRANEQVGLTAVHTVFVREHNRIARDLKQRNPELSGDEIYQRTRVLIGALMQEITYSEFLPLLIGKQAIPDYQGYNPVVDSSISNEFATAAFRVGHTMLSSQILRLDANGNESPEGHLRLRDAFFSPQQILQHGIDSLLRGLSKQRAQKVDTQIVDDVRNLLFGRPGSGGLDLASLNIQRGRDHGLRNYVETRESLGLETIAQFNEIDADSNTIKRLRSAYKSVDQLDLWVGGLAEAPYKDAMVGATFYRILVDQFTRLRDGDRFWYENHLSAQNIRWVQQQTLAMVIRRNTEIGSEISDHVFVVNRDAPLGAILLLISE